MIKKIMHFESDRVATISRALVENSLRMRAMAFLSQVKMSVMLNTLCDESDEPMNYMRHIRGAIGNQLDDWILLPQKISDEAKELQQMTLTIERRSEELGGFLADKTQALRLSERRYRQLMELIPDAVGVHCQGRWRYVNPAMQALFKADSMEALVNTSILERVHPNAHAQVFQSMQDPLNNEKISHLIQDRLLRLDGSEFTGEMMSRPLEYAGEASVLVVCRGHH